MASINTAKVYKPEYATPFLNHQHQLGRGLVFASIPGREHRRDLISGNVGFIPSGTGQTSWSGNSPIGAGGSSGTATSPAGGIAWEASNKFYETIKRQFTVVFAARLTDVNTFTKAVTVPYSTAWSTPFVGFGFAGHNTVSHRARLDYTVGASLTTVDDVSWDNFWVQGEFHFHTVTYNDGDVSFYLDRNKHGDTVASAGGIIDFNTREPLIIFNRNANDIGEGLGGVCPLVLIYNRVLPIEEIRQIVDDPYVLFRNLQPSLKIPSISGTIIGQGGLRRRLLRLYLRETGALVAETYGDPTTGDYSFSGLDPTKEYFVVELDE